MPTERHRDGQCGHGRYHVTGRALAGQQEYQPPHQQPRQQDQRVRRQLRQRFSIFEGHCHHADHHKGQQAGVFQIRQRLRPQAGAATVNGLVPPAQLVTHLANVFTHHKLAPDGAGVRIQHEPQRKHTNTNQHTHTRSQAGDGERLHAKICVNTVRGQQRCAPPGGGGRRNQSE